MQYSTLIHVISAMLFWMAQATPLNSTYSNYSDENIYFGTLDMLPTFADVVLSHLNKTSQITWEPAGSGSKTRISEETWQKGIAEATSSKPAARNLEKRQSWWVDETWFDHYGDPHNYTAYCWGTGAMGLETDIDNNYAEACSYLNGSEQQPLKKGEINIWKTGQMLDANGKTSYIKFSSKLLEDGGVYNSHICHRALNFLGVWGTCENADLSKKNGLLGTQGGQITIPKFAIMYVADPTDGQS